jgi:hypothetical protein
MLPPRCRRGCRSSGMLRRFGRYFVTDISVRPVGSILKGQTVQEECLDQVDVIIFSEWCGWEYTSGRLRLL